MKPTMPARIASTLRLIGPRPVLLTRSAAHAAARRVQQRRLAATYSRHVSPPRGRIELRAPTITIPAFESLPKQLRPAAEQIRLEADAACEHRTRLLVDREMELGDEIDWHRDISSGYRWPCVFYQDVEVTRLDDDSDAKAPWELSRGHQLLALARARCLYEDARYTRELERQLGHWLEANPPGMGINWTNTMEVAIRAINWVWALATLNGRAGLPDELRRSALASLCTHGRHIAANLEGAPYLRGNHYLADRLGLFVLGTCLAGEPLAPRWARQARRALEHEIGTQVHSDGMSFEASTAYHGLALEMFLIAHIVARATGEPFSARYRARLAGMLAASQTLRHPNGRIPLFGDNDSGRILPATSSRRPTHDQLLWLGAAALATTAPDAGQPHEEIAWTIGVDAWKRAIGLAVTGAPTSTRFPDAGLHVLRGKRAHAVARCGDVGQNGNGGHAHNDLLSYELSYGEPLVVDAGTYVYTADLAARDAYRSTRAHNTVVVDDCEINPIDPGQPFKLDGRAEISVDTWETTASRTRLVASHDGYRRLKCRAVHRRTFVMESTTDVFEVTDELLGTGSCDACSLLYLSPAVDIRWSTDGSVAAGVAGRLVVIEFDGFTQPLALVDGWVAPSYGVRQATTVVSARFAGMLPARFGYRILPQRSEVSSTPRATEELAL